MEYLDKKGVDYDAFDIMSDNDLRDQLKDYSNWKTYPQLFIDQQLQGGLDIVLDLERKG